MKAKWVATLNAGKFKAVFQFVKIFGTVLLMSLFLSIISCDKSDDLEPIGNEPPIDNESPPDNETPPDNESPPGEESLIVYTDIEPDFTSPMSGDFYNLDLNNDDIVDYTLSLWSDSLYDYLLISSPNGINASITVTPWYANTVPLENGMEIFNLVGAINGETYLYWGVFTIGNCFGGDATCSYDWKNKIDKFLGLRFLIDGQTHYGWARLDVTNLTQWVIKDYAYNATPNKPILAGQRN